MLGLVRRLHHDHTLKMEAERQWRLRSDYVLHDLNAPLIVSFTSYEPRFPFIERTARSLLSQSVRPDKVILWVAHGSAAKLPDGVKLLVKEGLEIQECQDIKSYKKLIPALNKYPNSFIITADDDQYYHRDWVKSFVIARPRLGEVLCMRARYMIVGYNGEFAPYSSWPTLYAEIASPAVLPIGVEGILYTPGTFTDVVLRDDLFSELCPTADDLWFFWTASLNGAQFRKIGGRPRSADWLGSQRTALFKQNGDGGGNDRALKRLCEVFGLPISLRAASVSKSALPTFLP